MPIKWADVLIALLGSVGISCSVTNRVNGWPETATINGRRCFMKSVTYDKSKGQYFLGIDPKKLNESGDLVILCGGFGGSLRDIFLIPWQEFFKIISMGEPINTYKLPKVYFQYKFKVHEKDGNWVINVQGATQQTKHVNPWHNTPSSALQALK